MKEHMSISDIQCPPHMLIQLLTHVNQNNLNYSTFNVGTMCKYDTRFG